MNLYLNDPKNRTKQAQIPQYKKKQKIIAALIDGEKC